MAATQPRLDHPHLTLAVTELLLKLHTAAVTLLLLVHRSTTIIIIIINSNITHLLLNTDTGLPSDHLPQEVLALTTSVFPYHRLLPTSPLHLRLATMQRKM